MNVDGAHIVARGISGRGPEGPVFENVHARVEPGSLAIIAGPSGSGRTSLLLALSGRLRLITGQLEVSGFVVPGDARAVRQLIAPARVRPGVELEELQLVREAVAERRMLNRVSTYEVDAALALVGLDPDPDALVCELHPGGQLLLTVALAIADRPPGIIVDDVAAGLPQPARDRVWSALREVARSRITVLASATEPPFQRDSVIWLPYSEGDDTEEIPLISGLMADEELRRQLRERDLAQDGGV